MDQNPYYHDSAVGVGSFERRAPDDVRIEISDADLLQFNERSPLLAQAIDNSNKKLTNQIRIKKGFLACSLISLCAIIGLDFFAFPNSYPDAYKFLNPILSITFSGGCIFGCLTWSDTCRTQKDIIKLQSASSSREVVPNRVNLGLAPSLKKLSFDVAAQHIGNYSINDIRLLPVESEVRESLVELHDRYKKLLENPRGSPSPDISEVNSYMI